MLGRAVWRPVGKYRVVGLHIAQCYVETHSPVLSHWTSHYTTQHLFVIPTANYAAKVLLRMGKERPKHVEFQEQNPKYCGITLDIYTYCFYLSIYVMCMQDISVAHTRFYIISNETRISG